MKKSLDVENLQTENANWVDDARLKTKQRQ